MNDARLVRLLRRSIRIDDDETAQDDRSFAPPDTCFPLKTITPNTCSGIRVTGVAVLVRVSEQFFNGTSRYRLFGAIKSHEDKIV